MDDADLNAAYTLIRGRVRALFPRASADDVVQESYLQAIAYTRNVGAAIDNPHGLVWSIARCQAQRPSLARRSAITGLDKLQMPSSVAAPWDAANSELNRQTIHHAIMQLPASYQDIVKRYYIDEQGSRQIASDLHISRATVRTRLYRARAKLRNALGGLVDGD